MKKLLFASLLLIALSPYAFARQRAVESRTGDAFVGPVRTARVEVAEFVRRDGALVEGPRRLNSVSSYTPDGRRKEYEGYAPGGSLLQRLVYVYDEAGNEVEMSKFDGRGNLQLRIVHRPAAHETLTYDGNGSLLKRGVWLKGAEGTAGETRTYDGGGALLERSVNTRDDGKSVWSTYGPAGTLKRRAVHSLDYGGPHHTEEQSYARDGSVVQRRVSDVDASVNDLRAVEEKPDGGPPRQTRQTREYDARRNLTKVTNFKWNAETGQYEPTSVSYTTIAYYR